MTGFLLVIGIAVLEDTSVVVGWHVLEGVVLSIRDEYP